MGEKTGKDFPMFTNDGVEIKEGMMIYTGHETGLSWKRQYSGSATYEIKEYEVLKVYSAFNQRYVRARNTFNFSETDFCIMEHRKCSFYAKKDSLLKRAKDMMASDIKNLEEKFKKVQLGLKKLKSSYSKKQYFYQKSK